MFYACMAIGQQFKNKILNEFRRRGVEKDAEYVFNVYDVIGKSFNLEGIGRQEPKVEFKRLNRFVRNKETGKTEEKPILGSFDPHDETTIYLSDLEEHRKDLMSQLSLYLGRWLEQKVLGTEQMENNLRWLQHETQDDRLPALFGNQPFYRIPHVKGTNLCVACDGSSMTVYRALPYIDNQGTRRLINPTNVFSSGMEWLTICPELLAKASPKHFTQVMRSLKILDKSSFNESDK